MIEAINSWLPLYMSGMIEPYYCKKPDEGRFSHTVFLYPDVACIEACHVRGYEGEGIYRYYVDQKHLALMKKAFAGLLQSSEPLVRVTSDWKRFSAPKKSSGGESVDAPAARFPLLRCPKEYCSGCWKTQSGSGRNENIYL